MRILFFSENFPPETNAAATRVYERALYWVRDGHEITVVTCFPNFPEGKVYRGYQNCWYKVENMSGIRVVRVKTFIAPNEGIVLRTLDFLSFLVSGFIASLFQRSPDIVAATSPQFFSAVCGWMAAAIRRRPFVFELGDLWPASITAVGAMKPNPLLSMLERFELFLYRRSAAVAALTPAFKQDLVRRGIPPGKIAVVINGVDLERYAPRPANIELTEKLSLTDKLVIGYIGTHGMAHGLESVLEAADHLRNEPVAFMFVGTGAAKDRLVAEAKRRALNNVHFVPPQPKAHIPDYWSICDAALVSLINQPLMSTVIPSKIFEAMGMGVPILLIAPPGEAQAIVEQRRAGICLPPQDPLALAESVRSLCRDEVLTQLLATNSAAAAHLYSRERQAQQMLQLFSTVLSRDASPGAALVQD